MLRAIHVPMCQNNVGRKFNFVKEKASGIVIECKTDQSAFNTGFTQEAMIKIQKKVSKCSRQHNGFYLMLSTNRSICTEPTGTLTVNQQ